MGRVAVFEATLDCVASTRPDRAPTLMSVRNALVGMMLVAVLVPLGAEAAAACSPRTFSSIQPPAPQPVEVAPTPQVEAPPEEQPPPASEEPTDPPPTGPPVEAPAAGETPSEELPAAPAPAVEPLSSWTPPPAACNFVYRMGFPVLGGGDPGWSVFGEIRGGGTRLHAGVDILAPQMTPVVAVRAGTVSTIRDTRGDCCWLTVRHDDGWTSMYVHLNDDNPGTNDGQGIGIRPDLVVGSRVAQGEMIGWVGDSGNAKGGPPHLHFELWTPWGEPVDPGPSLFAARRSTHPALAEDGALAARYGGAFIDYETLLTGTVFDTAIALGVPAWCDEWAVRSCPDSVATQEAVTRWIAALSGDAQMPYLFFAVDQRFDDPGEYVSARVDCDSPPVCAQPVTRGEVAVLIMQALQPASVVDQVQAISLLHGWGQIDVCDPNGLGPDDTLSREGALRMLLRAWGFLATPPCGLIA